MTHTDISADVIKQLRRRLIGHGALLVFAGGVIGFFFLFFLIGKVELWPIPGSIDYQMPGTYDGWRMAHIEGILNGVFLWLTAAVLGYLPFGEVGLKRSVTGLIVVGWTFVIASTIDPLFLESRGLEFGGPASNLVAFFLFYVGVLIVMIMMPIIAFKTLFSKQNS
ncbi:MAG: hypothetical protein ABF335_09750 [Alphaproteobacteria bacterium]